MIETVRRNLSSCHSLQVVLFLIFLVPSNLIVSLANCTVLNAPMYCVRTAKDYFLLLIKKTKKLLL